MDISNKATNAGKEEHLTFITENRLFAIRLCDAPQIAGMHKRTYVPFAHLSQKNSP